MFKVPAEGGPQACSTACAASGGAATGSVTACYVKPPQPEGGSDYKSGFNGTIGGDCKGNNWCKCGKIKAVAVGLDGKDLDPKDHTLQAYVGQEVTVHGHIEHFGGTQSGTRRTAIFEKASINFLEPDLKTVTTVPISFTKALFPGLTDASPVPDDILPNQSPADAPSKSPQDRVREAYAFYDQTATHTWQEPGTYSAWVQTIGQYKWNGEDGSCSYECKSVPPAMEYIYGVRDLCNGDENFILQIVVKDNIKRPSALPSRQPEGTH